MTDIEIPLGKRTKTYRFFEILPGAISIGAILLLIILSFLSPLAASLYILALVLLTFVRAITTAYRTIQGRIVMQRTTSLDWSKRLGDLAHPKKALKEYGKLSAKELRKQYKLAEHVTNLRQVSESGDYPKPRQILNVVMVALYNESYEVLGPTFRNLSEVDYDIKHNLVVLDGRISRFGVCGTSGGVTRRGYWQGAQSDLCGPQGV